MNLSYDYYRVFYHVAKCRSITQAAAVLQSNQPNVTRTIKNLESALECVRFTRSRQGVQLTPEGEKLFEHIRIAFEHIEAGEKELELDRTLQRGTVSIGTTDIALYCLLLRVLKEYRQDNPNIRIRIFAQSTPQAVSMLQSGLADLAIITTPVEIPDTLDSTVIMEFEDVAVCGSAFSYLADKQLSFEELAGLPLICLGEHTKTYEFYSGLFSKRGIPFAPSVEATAADQILSLVRNDLGIGFVPKPFLESSEFQETLHILQLGERIPVRKICLVKRGGLPLSIAAQKLEEMILAKAN